MADLDVPPDQTNKALRRLESGPALCAAAFVALTVWLLPILYLMFNPMYRPAPRSIWLIEGVLVGIAAVAWVIGVVLFRGSCRAVPGWIAALGKFHMYGLAIAVCGVVSLVAVFWCEEVARASRPYVPLLPILSTVAVVFACAVIGWWLYRRAKRVIAPFQRASAVHLARQWTQTERADK